MFEFVVCYVYNVHTYTDISSQIFLLGVAFCGYFLAG